MIRMWGIYMERKRTSKKTLDNWNQIKKNKDERSAIIIINIILLYWFLFYDKKK